MSQVKVTEYFSNRKRKGDVHASKRRKVQNVSEIDLASQVFVSPPISARTRHRKLPKTSGIVDLNTHPEPSPSGSETQTEIPNQVVTKSEPKGGAKSKPKTTVTVARSRKTRGKNLKKIAPSEGCLDIRSAFEKISAPIDGSGDCQNSTDPRDCCAVPTAAKDDHCAIPPCTPTKSVKEGDAVIARKRPRGKSQPKDLLTERAFQTPEKFSFEQADTTKTSARK
jgi:hypothetical protein